MEFSRTEYWSEWWPFPSPRDLPNPAIEPRSPALQVNSLPAKPQGKHKNAGVPPGDLPNPGIEPGSPALQVYSFPLSSHLPPLCEVKVVQSCPTLCHPMDYIVLRILQTRILEWVAFPFSRGSSQPRDRTQVSCIADGFFTSWATMEALTSPILCYYFLDLNYFEEGRKNWETIKLKIFRKGKLFGVKIKTGKSLPPNKFSST